MGKEDKVLVAVFVLVLLAGIFLLTEIRFSPVTPEEALKETILNSEIYRDCPSKNDPKYRCPKAWEGWVVCPEKDASSVCYCNGEFWNRYFCPDGKICKKKKVKEGEDYCSEITGN